MGDKYKSLAEIARAKGVSPPAVTAWAKKFGWPRNLDRAAVDAFVDRVVLPHRRGKQKEIAGDSAPPPAAAAAAIAAIRTNAAPGIASLGESDITPQTPIAATAAAAAAPPAMPARTYDDEFDVETATLEELEQRIRRTRSTETAERLSKQVRALKVIREIQERDGKLIDAELARTEIRAAMFFLTTGLMSVPAAVSASLEGLKPTDMRAVLEGRFTELLGELARGLKRAIDFEPNEPDAAAASDQAAEIGSGGNVGSDTQRPDLGDGARQTAPAPKHEALARDTGRAEGARKTAAQPDGTAIPDPLAPPILPAGHVG